MVHVTDSDFPSTHWTLVGNARRGTPQERRQALGDLLSRYIEPLKAFAQRRFGVDAAEADDLVQGFMLDKVLEEDLLAHADQMRGRFRDFLRGVLNRFVLEEFRRRRRLKRGGGAVVSIEDLPMPAAATDDVSAMFDIEWAQAVLNEAAARVRLHCESSGRTQLWHVFDARVLGPTLRQEEPIAYRELVERLGFESPDQASNALMTAKRMYVRSLHSVVGEYAKEERSIREEIADLRRILANG